MTIQQGSRRSPLDVEQAAEYLGTSARHLRRLTSEKKIPYLKLVGKIRFLPDDLDGWIDAGRVEVAQPIA